MRKLWLTLAGAALLGGVVGCHHTCGYCDCDQGCDHCTYYYGHGCAGSYQATDGAAPHVQAKEPIAMPAEAAKEK
jgi:hypothetical protein